MLSFFFLVLLFCFFSKELAKENSYKTLNLNSPLNFAQKDKGLPFINQDHTSLHQTIKIHQTELNTPH